MLWICILALAIYGIVNEIRQRKRERREETACGVIEQRSIERARKAAEERDEIRRTADRREKELAAWRASVEKEQKKIEAAQRKQRAEQERQKKEQERQAAQLAKHEEQIRKMQFQLEQATADIDHLTNTLSELDAMLDYLKMEQSGTTPGGKEYAKYQTKIISLENRVHTTETRLAKAQHAKAEAERKLA